MAGATSNEGRPMKRLAFALVTFVASCGSPSGMSEAPASPNPAPANEPDTEPLPPSPKKKVPDPRAPLDAGHGK
jgi:hypothetical protein